MENDSSSYDDYPKSAATGNINLKTFLTLLYLECHKKYKNDTFILKNTTYEGKKYNKLKTIF